MNPSKLDNINSTNIETVSQSDLNGPKEELNRKIRSAALDGFFYLEMPEKSKQYLPAALDFANTFYQNKDLREMELPGWSGYGKEDHSQREYFFCERSLWPQVYDVNVEKLAGIFSDLCHRILTVTLSVFHVPEKEWHTLTGGQTSHKGIEHFSFNHYRDTVQKLGVKVHRDFGLITGLYINKDGLMARIRNKKWMPIRPKEGHIVINFGRALETLINRPDEFQAAWHKVDQLYEDRISFGLFSDNSLDSSVYKMTEKGSIIVRKHYSDYINDCFKDIYSE